MSINKKLGSPSKPSYDFAAATEITAPAVMYSLGNESENHENDHFLLRFFLIVLCFYGALYGIGNIYYVFNNPNMHYVFNNHSYII